ncbi:MAG: sigma-70 family RNA polymerase sigma factor [Alsobacter sp.]
MGTREDDDIAALLAATAAGDRSAFRRIYERTAPKLLGVILRMRLDRAAAEDVLQDVFLRVWTKAATYTPEAGPALGWLVAIARYRTIDHLRRRVPESAEPEEDGTGPLDRAADPLDLAGVLADRDALRQCLAGLDPVARDCIVLAYVEGWSRDELGRRHGRPANTIKTWLHRGLAALRRCLDGT